MIGILVSNFGIIVGAVIAAFTVIKLNRDYQHAESERTRIKAIETAAGRTAIASLEESVKGLRTDRERLIKEFQGQIDTMEHEMEKLEQLIRDGNHEAIRECEDMRKQMHSFIQDTWKIFLNK